MMNRKGFTLIELLIVVVIIGILAAIAIPKFATTKDKAKLASVKTDLRNYMTAQEAYFSDKATYGTAAQLAGRRVQLHLLERQRGHREHRCGGWILLTAGNTSISTGTASCTSRSAARPQCAADDGVIKCP